MTGLYGRMTVTGLWDGACRAAGCVTRGSRGSTRAGVETGLAGVRTVATTVYLEMVEPFAAGGEKLTIMAPAAWYPTDEMLGVAGTVPVTTALLSSDRSLSPTELVACGSERGGRLSAQCQWCSTLDE